MKESVPDYSGILELAQRKLDGKPYTGDLVRGIEVLRRRVDTLVGEKEALQKSLDEAYLLSNKLGQLAEDLKQISLRGR